MKKTYHAPVITVVKIQTTNLMELSNGGNAKENGIKTADSRSQRTFWDDDDCEE